LPEYRSVIAPKKTCECPCHYVVGHIISPTANDTRETVFNGYFCFLFRTELEDTFLSKKSAESISSFTAKQEAVKSIGENSCICQWEERKHMSCLKLKKL